jgi:hypothetical protein
MINGGVISKAASSAWAAVSGGDENLTAAASALAWLWRGEISARSRLAAQPRAPRHL